MTSTPADQSGGPADAAAAARAYIEAVGRHDLGPLEQLFAPDLVARFAGSTFTKQAWIGALGRLLPALVRNDILDVFGTGERACVVYDFVTDTPAGAVRCVEVLTVHKDTIVEVELILDRVAFAPVNTALAERASS